VSNEYRARLVCHLSPTATAAAVILITVVIKLAMTVNSTAIHRQPALTASNLYSRHLDNTCFVSQHRTLITPQGQQQHTTS